MLERCVLCVSLQMRRAAQVGVDGVRRVDWHDYEAIRKDAARTGQSPKMMPRNMWSCGHMHARVHVHTQNSKSIFSCFFVLLNSSIGFSPLQPTESILQKQSRDHN